MGFSRQEYWRGLPFPSPYNCLCACVCMCMYVYVVPQSSLTLCDSRDGTHQALLSMGFFRQEYWSGFPFSFPYNSKSCPLSWRCHPTISSSVSPSPPAFNLSQHQGFFQWVSSLHQVAKALEFQLQYQSFQ